MIHHALHPGPDGCIRGRNRMHHRPGRERRALNMQLQHRNALPIANQAETRRTRHRLAQGLIVLGVVATAGIALAGPAKLMRELRSRIFESERGTLAGIERSRPGRRRRARRGRTR